MRPAADLQPVDISATPDEIPAWADAIKPDSLKSLEAERRILSSKIADLTVFLHLVTATDMPLVNATVQALRLFGLEATPTERGANIDIEAVSKDGSKSFDIEVTGIDGDLGKKRGGKTTQLSEAVMESEGARKGLLVANTWRFLPLSQREGKDHFTPPVAKYMTRFDVLMMTGYDLYRLVLDVQNGRRSGDEVIEELYSTVGVFKYTSR